MADKPAADPRTVYLKGVRLSYPHLHERHKASEDAQPKFSATFLIDPSTKEGKMNIRKLEAAVKAAELQAFKKSGLKYKSDRNHFMDGNECLDKAGEIKVGYEDMMVVKASNKDPIKLIHRNKKPVEADKTPFYAGCIVEGFVNAYGTTKGGSNGLFFTMDAVRFWEDGERIGRGEISDDAFDDDDEDEGYGQDEDEDDLV